MKKIITQISTFLLFAATDHSMMAQCATTTSLGSSSNMLTKNKNNGSTVVVDKDLNTVVFIHRNHQGTFGGSSGHLRYDISTDGGATWVNNQGPVNPTLTRQARFPNVAIYNPAGNTNPNNAYLTYLAPTINNSGNWSGVVSGVRKLDGTGNTETYNQPGPTNQILGSLAKGAPGVYWATDFTYNGTQFTGGILIYKGVWSGNAITWSLNQQFNPSYNLSFSGNPPLGEASIAFDPTGKFGWMCVTAHLSSSSNFNRYLPVFYQTTNGGNSWSGPMTVDLSQYNCITGAMGSSSTPGIYYANDLTVDMYGNPHLMLTVGVGNTSYGINNNQWHHVFDITQKHGVWTAYDIANIQVEYATIFPGSLGSNVYQTMHPQVSRTADGSKVFFSWTDNTFYPLGTPNMSPNLFARGFDVVQNKWTPAKDFTDCSPGASGDVFFPHMAEEVLEPSAGDYKLAIVYASTMTNGDPDMPAGFSFLNNVVFKNADFTVNQPVLNPLTLTPKGPIAICAGNSASVQLSGSFQEIAWSNGAGGLNTSFSIPNMYYVGARQGCVVGWDSVAVVTLSMSASSGTVNACEGVTKTLTINGNAHSYTWTPGPSNGASITVIPASNTIYTITGVGINTCSVSRTLSLVVNPVPTVNVISSNAIICEGEKAILEATGANTYSWSSGATTYSTAVFPIITTDYSVTGVNSQGCPGTFTFTQVVDPCTGLAESAAVTRQLLVYPNPAAGKLNISSEADMRCTLSNELGQVLLVIDLGSENNRSVILTDLAPGIYFLNGNLGGTPVYRKVIIQK